MSHRQLFYHFMTKQNTQRCSYFFILSTKPYFGENAGVCTHMLFLLKALSNNA